jgi:hypothetical protein
MDVSTQKLGEWLDKLINMGNLTFDEKEHFTNELIAFFADPKREEYEKCQTLKELNGFLRQRRDGAQINMEQLMKNVQKATGIIYFLVNSIQREVNRRVDKFKTLLTTGEE